MPAWLPVLASTPDGPLAVKLFRTDGRVELIRAGATVAEGGPLFSPSPLTLATEVDGVEWSLTPRDGVVRVVPLASLDGETTDGLRLVWHPAAAWVTEGESVVRGPLWWPTIRQDRGRYTITSDFGVGFTASIPARKGCGCGGRAA